MAVNGGKIGKLSKGFKLLISITVLGGLAWAAYFRPASKRQYAFAVEEYERGDYKRSLELLAQASRYNPISTPIVMLFARNNLALGNYQEARKFYQRALGLNPRLDDARLGIAYSALELGDNYAAIEYFHQLPFNLSNSRQVRVALTRAHRQRGENQVALRLAKQLLEEDPYDPLAIRELAFLTGAEDLETLEATQSPPAAKPAELVVAARLQDRFFQVPREGTWATMYIHGVNLGPATPGNFASEPPLQMSVYADWLHQISAMGANCVRVYTLLPPAFYRALLSHNRLHPKEPLYLFQEIWLKDAPRDNLFDQGFQAEFEKECRDVVDAIHGRADIPIRRGHAGGLYASNVSPYVLGWLVGREIEPRVVISTNLRNHGVASFQGRYLKISGGNPTEVWLTQMCEKIVEYEVTQYGWQRPVSFVNWPPLDALSHPTESRLVDELRMRSAMGEKLAPLGLGVQDDVDVVSLDEEKISPQPALQAGYFALYHVYPFWPDFLILDPAYRAARDESGPNAYWGYLQDLRKHFKKTPLVIGEYGISTSAGIAHFHPSGWNHGGMNETEQGQLLIRLTRNIQESGFAGGIIFEWIDEWWKHNWIADDFEKPSDRRALWHNDLNPEKSFGLMKFTLQEPLTYTSLNDSGKVAAADLPGGTAHRPPLVSSVRTSSDPSALYIDLVLDIPPGTEPDWSTDRYQVALNTCDAPCGSDTLPFLANTLVKDGANFVVVFAGPESSRLLVARSYNPYRILPVEGVQGLTELTIPGNLTMEIERRGPFEELVVETNRRRFGRDGTLYPAIRYSRSILRYGNFDPSGEKYDSLGQCYFDTATGRIRLRLSWGLLLVLDPSQGLVLRGTDEGGKTAGKVASQIRIAVAAYAGGDPMANASPAQILAKTVSGNTIVECLSMPWPTWSTVNAWASPKQSYAIIRDTLGKTFLNPGRHDATSKSR